jgi:hypothetical protein
MIPWHWILERFRAMFIGVQDFSLCPLLQSFPWRGSELISGILEERPGGGVSSPSTEPERRRIGRQPLTIKMGFLSVFGVEWVRMESRLAMHYSLYS